MRKMTERRRRLEIPRKRRRREVIIVKVCLNFIERPQEEDRR